MPALDMITEQNKRSLSWTQVWANFKYKVQQTYNTALTSEGYKQFKSTVSQIDNHLKEIPFRALLDDTQTTKRVDKIIQVL